MQLSSDLENPPPSYTSATAGEDDSSSINVSSHPPEIHSPPPALLPPDISTTVPLPEIEPPSRPDDEQLPPYHLGRPSQPNFDFVRNSIARPPSSRPVFVSFLRLTRRSSHVERTSFEAEAVPASDAWDQINVRRSHYCCCCIRDLAYYKSEKLMTCKFCLPNESEDVHGLNIRRRHSLLYYVYMYFCSLSSV